MQIQRGKEKAGGGAWIHIDNTLREICSTKLYKVLKNDTQSNSGYRFLCMN